LSESQSCLESVGVLESFGSVFPPLPCIMGKYELLWWLILDEYTVYILRSAHQKQHDPKIGPNLSDRRKWPSRSGSTDHGPLHHFKVKGKASKNEKITENLVKIGYTTDIMRQLMISTEIDDLVLGIGKTLFPAKTRLLQRTTGHISLKGDV